MPVKLQLRTVQRAMGQMRRGGRHVGVVPLWRGGCMGLAKQDRAQARTRAGVRRRWRESARRLCGACGGLRSVCGEAATCALYLGARLVPQCGPLLRHARLTLPPWRLPVDGRLPPWRPPPTAVHAESHKRACKTRALQGQVGLAAGHGADSAMACTLRSLYRAVGRGRGVGLAPARPCAVLAQGPRRTSSLVALAVRSLRVFPHNAHRPLLPCCQPSHDDSRMGNC